MVPSTNVAQDDDNSWAISASKDQDFGARAFDANESESISLSLPESFQYDSADEEGCSGDGDSEYGGGGASSLIMSPGATRWSPLDVDAAPHGLVAQMQQQISVLH
jgi:hypothetical protein